MGADKVIVQGEDLGTRAAAQRTGECPGVVVLSYAGLGLLDLVALGEVEDHDLPYGASSWKSALTSPLAAVPKA
jgi:hypothetical protein